MKKDVVGSATIYLGDCVEVMRSLAESSVDAIVTDPPYGLEFMRNDWDAPWKGDVRQPGDATFHASDATTPFGKVRHGGTPAYRSGADTMQLFQAWCETWAREALRVLKPGGHLVAFGGSRTYHRLACAIEDAGFEVRDQIMWIYGSGFPKSLDVGKAIDKAAGAEREVVGDKLDRPGYHLHGHEGGEAFGAGISSSTPETRLRSATITAPATDAAREWDGWGTALKPSHEPIVLARKPIKGTVADNVTRYGTGALNIDECRIDLDDGETIHAPQSDPNNRVGAVGATAFVTQRDPEAMKEAQRESVERANTMGRWPANVIHDGSDEVTALFPESKASGDYPSDSMTRNGVTPFSGGQGPLYADNGSAARFFYCPKADREDRNDGLQGMKMRAVTHYAQALNNGSGGLRNGDGTVTPTQNHHPTVKPTALMVWLCKLITPPGGLILDPFMGSGSTGRGATLGDFRFIGIDNDADYVEIARRRIVAISPLFMAAGL